MVVPRLFHLERRQEPSPEPWLPQTLKAAQCPTSTNGLTGMQRPLITLQLDGRSFDQSSNSFILQSLDVHTKKCQCPELFCYIMLYLQESLVPRLVKICQNHIFQVYPNLSILLQIKPFIAVAARLAVKASIPNCGLEIARDSNDGSFWLINGTDSDTSMAAKEIFGFNTGSFTELTSGLRGMILSC